MRSYGEGSLSATTKVKVSSPEILLFALGQGFHLLEANTGARANGERVSGVPGSESVAGKRTVCIGTWENRGVPRLSHRGAEEATRRYGALVVGLTHSRGVGGVIPAASSGTGTLDRVSSFTQRVEV